MTSMYIVRTVKSAQNVKLGFGRYNLIIIKSYINGEL